MLDLAKYSDKRICVAVSGGRDSVALLHYLLSQRGKYGYALSAAHCEHGIRGEESFKDMRFVEGLCKQWGVPLFLFSDDCPARAKREKASLETAARNFRYESFATLIAEGKADFIATAHHQLDEAETVLFRIMRGTSLSGAIGMKAENGYILRPFLSWKRSEIEKYAEENGLSHREDKTNADVSITRNKIRLELLPKMEETVAGAVGNIIEFSISAGEDDALLYEYAAELLTAEKEGCGEQFRVRFSEKKPLFRRACLTAMKALGITKDYTRAHLDNLFALQASERGSRLDLPQGIEAVREADGLLFRVKREREKIEKPTPRPFAESYFDGGRYEVIVSKEPLPQENGWKVLRVDGDKIPNNAVFRFREEGDGIERFGGGTKSLKKFFNEKKIPVGEREYLPLIAQDKEVYAVCGVEISEKTRVEQGSKNILYIALREK